MTSPVAAFLTLTLLAGAAVGLRQRHARNASGVPPVPAPLNQTSLAPPKPPLWLTFEMLLRSEDGEVQNVSVDASLLAISVREMEAGGGNDTGLPQDGEIFNLRQGHHFMHQRFFEEVVCYQHDLPGMMVARVQNGSAAADNETFKNHSDEQALILAMGHVLKAPLELYTSAEEFKGGREVAGLNCSVWAVNHASRAPFGQLATSARLSRPGSRAPSTLSLMQTVRNSTSLKVGDAEIVENVTFCVTSSGELLATNSSVTFAVELVGDGKNSTWMTLWSDFAQSVALAAPTHSPEPKLFHGAHGVAGGHCIDLTHGTVGETELKSHLNSAERLHRINTEAAGQWSAGPYKLWEGITVAEIVQSLGTHIEPLRLPLKQQALQQHLPFGGISLLAEKAMEPPRNFDSRSHWSQCVSIGSIRNQGMCGSCWAFAATGVLADRVCIATTPRSGARHHGASRRLARVHNLTAASYLQEHAVVSLSLAPEHMVNCDTKNAGCGGGRLDDAWWFLRDHGVPTETCRPYSHCQVPTQPGCTYGPNAAPARFPAGGGAAAGGEVAECAATCAGGTEMQVYRAAAAYAVGPPGDVRALQQELLAHGPVEVGFFVFSDFHSYREGVYARTPGAYGPLGGHAVRLLGWGTSESAKQKHGTDYWLAANTWSPVWGLGGFFRIRRGTNECGIETTPAAGLPLLHSGSGGRGGAAAAAASAEEPGRRGE